MINNGFVAIAESTTISIGRRCLIGPEVQIFDSDFHALDPEARRLRKQPEVGPVKVGDDVFIAARTTILKGATIGNGSVIGVGSVVTRNVPPNCVVAGAPARVVGRLDAYTDKPESTSGVFPEKWTPVLCGEFVDVP